ncbi:hypothetical protein B0T10DRAFT_488411 [Thelonectria olida]|uniref:Secreted protein n=1 Tax=Thelonectria olida TaxID=1576542 RepID=A0A9P8W2N1_9HYPO|nr:hypothetical protein B0T10DRAFT_488411 [Thelonectria olida]
MIQTPRLVAALVIHLTVLKRVEAPPSTWAICEREPRPASLLMMPHYYYFFLFPRAQKGVSPFSRLSYSYSDHFSRPPCDTASNFPYHRFRGPANASPRMPLQAPGRAMRSMSMSMSGTATTWPELGDWIAVRLDSFFFLLMGNYFIRS